MRIGIAIRRFAAACIFRGFGRELNSAYLGGIVFWSEWKRHKIAACYIDGNNEV